MILSDSNSGPWLYDRKHHQEFGDRYLDLLRVRGSATAAEIAEALGVLHMSALRAMYRRQERGLVTCSTIPGPGPGQTLWRLL